MLNNWFVTIVSELSVCVPFRDWQWFIGFHSFCFSTVSELLLQILTYWFVSSICYFLYNSNIATSQVPAISVTATEFAISAGRFTPQIAECNWVLLPNRMFRPSTLCAITASVIGHPGFDMYTNCTVACVCRSVAPWLAVIEQYPHFRPPLPVLVCYLSTWNTKKTMIVLLNGSIWSWRICSADCVNALCDRVCSATVLAFGSAVGDLNLHQFR
jgi:hypothetical protein